MIVRLLFLLLACSFVFSCPLWASERSPREEKVPTVVIPAYQGDDQFDRDFEDDFDDEFGDEFGENGDFVPKQLIADPLEGWNRGVFWVNDRLYFYLFKPVARGYRFVVPKPARISVDNFFKNLATPIRFANSVLQLNFYQGGTELYRFVVNSTVGVAGLFDPATSVGGVEREEEDFGQTLGYYGMGHGFYLVLPVIGPSSLRDGGGMLVDTFFDPIRYVSLDLVEYMALHGFKMANRLSLDPDTYEGIIRDALDPYLFIRSAYAQRRLAQVGKTPYNLRTFNKTMDMINNTLLDKDTYNPFKWKWLGE